MIDLRSDTVTKPSAAMRNGWPEPRGGTGGASGRIMFSEALKISVN